MKVTHTHTVTHSLTHSLIHTLTHSLTHSLTLSHSLTHSFTPSLTHTLTRSLTHSHSLSLTHSLNHSLTPSLPRSLAHSLPSLTVTLHPLRGAAIIRGPPPQSVQSGPRGAYLHRHPVTHAAVPGDGVPPGRLQPLLQRSLLKTAGPSTQTL